MINGIWKENYCGIYVADPQRTRLKHQKLVLGKL
jgi:hypothetical protein